MIFFNLLYNGDESSRVQLPTINSLGTVYNNLTYWPKLTNLKIGVIRHSQQHPFWPHLRHTVWSVLLHIFIRALKTKQAVSAVPGLITYKKITCCPSSLVATIQMKHRKEGQLVFLKSLSQSTTCTAFQLSPYHPQWRKEKHFINGNRLCFPWTEWNDNRENHKWHHSRNPV